MMPDHANGIPTEKDANSVEVSTSAVTGSEICARCRKPRTKRGADGECLRCLVGFALMHAQGTEGDPGSFFQMPEHHSTSKTSFTGTSN